MAGTTQKPTTKTVKAEAEKPAATEFDAYKTVEDYTSAAREQFEKVYENYTSNVEELREKSEDFTAEVKARMEKSRDVATEINSEIIENAKQEFADTVKMVNDLSKAKTVTDVFAIQKDFWTNLYQTRSDSAQALTAKSVEATKEALSPYNTDFEKFFSADAMKDFFPFSSKA